MIISRIIVPASLLAKANILIDEAGHARLTDFGLLTLFMNFANTLSSGSGAQDGVIRWMSPELIYPEKFELKESPPTARSDCYALGMVVYETISGNLPFHRYRDHIILSKVVNGEHPHREGEFADCLWEILESCWKFQPGDRPSVKDVLQCLKTASNPSGRSHGPNREIETRGDDGRNSPGGSFDAERPSEWCNDNGKHFMPCGLGYTTAHVLGPTLSIFRSLTIKAVNVGSEPSEKCTRVLSTSQVGLIEKGTYRVSRT